MTELPPLVARACDAARRAGFPLTRDEAGHGRASACLPAAGQVLAMLAAGCAGGRLAEMGTGAGVGAAWMASAMPSDCTLITVETDERLAAVAREVLAADPRVEVITGDAARVLPGRAPFDLLFADGGRPVDETALISLIRPGGRIVMDDVTPVAALPGDSPWRAHDPKRHLFFGTPLLASAEVVLPDLRNSVLVGTRVR